MKGKIRFGMVGTGFIADWVLAGARQDPRFEAAAVCSRSQATADAFAAKHGIPHTFTSLEEMARSPLVDAVYIASPNALHASQSILCMSCGKHVLCEKPLASNAREARAMIEAARRYGVVLMEAMIATLNPNFRIVREQLPGSERSAATSPATASTPRAMTSSGRGSCSTPSILRFPTAP